MGNPHEATVLGEENVLERGYTLLVLMIESE
jgi:hypothetical protein